MQDEAVRLVVGLGNPGEDYRHQRHNLGFRVVEEVARRLGLTFQAGDPSYLCATGAGPTAGITLLKPLTYMNRSGQAILDWSRDTGVAVTGQSPVPEGVSEEETEEAEASPPLAPVGVRPLVVCDDLSLPLGSVRLRPSGSSGGQNGLASVIDRLGGEDFPRLRLGIAPLAGDLDPEDWSDYVLGEFGEEERPGAEELVTHAAAALLFWFDQGLEATVSRFNRRVRADSDSTG
jgi:PTH1 family peptidyl-tRNA hydrolase